jgi:predicted nucleic-acid-binding protein
MRAVDTNVLLRIVVRDDELQTRAADGFIEAGAWVSHVVLAEAIWVLSRHYERPSADVMDAIEKLLHHRSLTMEQPDVVSQALALYRERPSLGFSDCLILEIARMAGHLPLGTFDRSLAKAQGARAV